MVLAVFVRVPIGALAWMMPAAAMGLFDAFVASTVGNAVAATAYLQLTGRVSPRRRPSESAHCD